MLYITAPDSITLACECFAVSALSMILTLQKLWYECLILTTQCSDHAGTDNAHCPSLKPHSQCTNATN